MKKIFIVLILVVAAVGVVGLITGPDRDSPNDTSEIVPKVGSFGTEVSLAGEIVCLPHKDTDGPTTLECAFGILDSSGDYYGLRDLDQAGLVFGNINTGDRVVATGVLQEPETDQVYNIVGVVEVESVEHSDEVDPVVQEVDVSVSSEKKSYSQSEEVKITVANNSSESILIHPEYLVGIEKKNEDGVFNPIGVNHEESSLTIYFPDDYKSVDQGSGFEYVWDQTKQAHDEFGKPVEGLAIPAGEGVYRAYVIFVPESKVEVSDPFPQEGDYVEVRSEEFTISSDDEIYQDPEEGVTAFHQYKDGTHTVAGKIDLPTPCHFIEISTIVMESYPEQVIFDLIINKEEGGACSQVVTPKAFKESVNVSQYASFAAQINGEGTDLDLVIVGPDEDIDILVENL